MPDLIEAATVALRAFAVFAGLVIVVSAGVFAFCIREFFVQKRVARERSLEIDAARARIREGARPSGQRFRL